MTYQLFWRVLWISCGLSMAAQAADIEDLLDPDQAFALNVTVSGPDTVIAEWTIADGYYLYRERFRFESATPGIRLGEPRFPPGQPKDDPFFGRMETYRQRVAVTLPIARDQTAPDDLQLTTVAQGCADIGVCYPPQTRQVTLSLPQAPTSTSASDAATPFSPGMSPEPPPTPYAANLPSNLSNAGGAETATLFKTPQPEDALLPPEQAFALSVTTPDPLTVVAHWVIAEDHYLYRDRLTLELLDAEGIRIIAVDRLPGEAKEDEFFGRQAVFHHDAVLTAHLQRTDTAARDIQVRVGYQGCAEKLGVCYPPQRQLIPVTLAAVEAGADPVGR